MDRSTLTEVLDDPVARELYATVELARLGYNAPDGSPRVIPIGYARLDPDFAVFTTPNAAKVRALEHDNRVALSIDADTTPARALLVRGTAHLEVINGVPQDYLETNRKRTTPEQYDAWKTEVIRLYDQMVRITITPTWAKILDFETRIPSAVEELARQKSDQQT